MDSWWRGATARSWPNGLYVARVTAGRQLLDPTGIRIAQGSPFPQIVFAGDTYSVFWTELHSGGTVTTLYVARVNRDGRVVDGPRIIADGVPGAQYRIATNGRRIVVAWPDRLFVLSAEGELLERDIAVQKCPASLACTGATPRLASNGSGFLLALPKASSSTTRQSRLESPRMAAAISSSTPMLKRATPRH